MGLVKYCRLMWKKRATPVSSERRMKSSHIAIVSTGAGPASMVRSPMIRLSGQNGPSLQFSRQVTGLRSSMLAMSREASLRGSSGLR